MPRFPEDFIFGSATASYQVEGAWDEEGKLPSIWDRFCTEEGAILDHSDGKIACDQYYLFKDDVALMSSLGIKAYRFSISWPRIVNADLKTPNLAGIKHYQKLCECLLSHNIQPVATLYHWDMPQILQDRGGWPNRETAYAFSDYASICFKYLGSLVSEWITINEPWCVAYLGYLNGIHAPGISDRRQAFDAIHHVNLAHGLAVKAYRESGLAAPIGIALNPQMPRPATLSPENIKAAETARLIGTDIFLLPLFGAYPSDLNRFGLSLPIQEGDLSLISQNIDFIGINYYNESPVIADDSEELGYANAPSWEPTTDMPWPIVPNGLLRVLRYFNAHLRKGMKLIISENGAAFDDVLTPDGRVHDSKRISYLEKHFDICLKAIDEGIPLSGYYLWSLLDNFEWSYGYTKRFGIVYTDYQTQTRYPKDSAYFYRDVISGMLE